MSKKVVGLALAPDIVKKLDRLCDETHRSRSNLIEFLIKKACVKRSEEKKDA